MTCHYLVAFCTVSRCGSLSLTCGCVLCRPCCVLVVRGAISRAMAQAASRRPVTTEAPPRSDVSPCDIYCGQSDTETSFSPGTFASIIPPVLHTNLHLHVVLSRTSRRNLGNSQKQCFVGSQGVLEMKGTFTGSAVARRY